MVGIIDYGVGNLFSLQSSFKAIGEEAFVSGDMEELAKRLSRAGYERRSQVDGPCQFSVRGGILDFYSPQSSCPVRIEFWGDEADSVALFDLETQRRTKEIEEAFVAPAREVLPDSSEALVKVLKDAHSKQRGKHGVLVKQNMKGSIPDFRFPPRTAIFPLSINSRQPFLTIFRKE
mgnify:CR=1 FL=1